MELNLLIVEDSEMYRMVIEKMFDNTIKYNVSSVDSVKKAKEILGGKKFDIVLLDITLLDGLGNDIVKFIRKEQNNQKAYIVAITGEVAEDSIATLFKMGIDYYIKKPFNPVIVKSTVDRLYDRINSERV